MPVVDSIAEYEHLERVNLNMFNILSVVLQEQSITRAGVRLNMSQSAVSGTLARLRTMLGDPLLVRGKSRLVPTERALELIGSLSAVTECVELLSGRAHGKSDAIVPRKCVVACIDEISSILVPAITAEILRSSEHTSVEFKSIEAEDVSQELWSGSVDTAIVSTLGEVPIGHELIGTDELVCLMSKRHPLSRQPHISRAQYEKAEHVALLSHRGRPQYAIESALRARQMSRRNTVAMPFADVIPHLLERSGLLFTTSRRFAEHYASFLPLHMSPLDVELPPINYFQMSTFATRDPLRISWVKAKVRAAWKTLQAENALNVP
ncbi:LysR family transcriptional regulator [Paraburkholderia unamae]|uniref:DNA-binding transcriptional LysR family regulator n=1 Tax=Paraburkholderia unamae TaxID=219649 RepID=A0ABX5KLA3_9BURK|nr:LysR family transcriptional regulator [Paraburkholderia unamae]PVX82436.1 DNA-binding transcriptional LysR family regulator [Paraburkholderia unamae]